MDTLPSSALGISSDRIKFIDLFLLEIIPTSTIAALKARKPTKPIYNLTSLIGRAQHYRMPNVIHTIVLKELPNKNSSQRVSNKINFSGERPITPPFLESMLDFSIELQLLAQSV